MNLITREGILLYPWDVGFGPVLGSVSRAIASAVREARVHRDRSVTLGWRNFLKEVVLDMWSERSKAGWDGYGAVPISKASTEVALRLIDLIPDTVENPEVVPDPDGYIGFEWRRGKDAILTACATGDGVLVYSLVLRSGTHQHGEEPFLGELPDSIARLLQKHFPRR